MSDAPPPFPTSSSQPMQPSYPVSYQQSPYTQPAAPAGGKNSNNKTCLGCGCGCLVVLIICAILGYFAYVAGMKWVEESLDQYTGKHPVPVEAPVASPSDVQQSMEKLEAFRQAMDSDGQPAELSLTDHDINVLLNHHPDLKELAGKAKITLEDGNATAHMSLKIDDLDLPPNPFTDKLKGRYFNGSVKFSVDTVQGKPAVHIQDLTVNQLSVPEPFMTEIRKENILSNMDEESMKAFLDQVGEMKIEGNRFIIRPKNAP